MTIAMQMQLCHHIRMRTLEDCPRKEYCNTQRTQFGVLADAVDTLTATSYDGLAEAQDGLPEAQLPWGHSAGDSSMFGLALPDMVRSVAPADPCEGCSLVALANQMAPPEPPAGGAQPPQA
jgi:hypothetical protein